MRSINRVGKSKSKGIIGRALIGVLLCLALMGPVAAQEPVLRGTFRGTSVSRTVSFTHQGRARTETVGSLRLQLDNGPEILTFCIEINVVVRQNARYRSEGPVLALPNGCQIRYILDNYPAETATTPNEAAARQMAIWKFSDGLDLTTITDAAVRDRAIAIASEAESKPCPGRRTQPPDLKIIPEESSADVDDIVQFTVSAGALDAGRTAIVAIDGPASFADAKRTRIDQRRQAITLDAQGNG